MKYYAYMRCSTSTQMKNNGFQEQEVEIEKFVKANNIKIESIFTDGGISGTKEDRDGLIDLINTLEKGDKVIVLNTSRLWRDDGVKFFVHRQMKKIGADIVSIENPRYSLYINDPSDYLVNSMMEVFDAYQRMEIAMKLQKGRSAKAKHGGKACGNTPYGYKWDGKNVVADENKASVVRNMFNEYLETRSTSKIKRLLDEAGIKTNRENNFSIQAIKNILTNDFYIGVVTHNGMKYPGKHDTIVGKEVFERVQEMLTKQKGDITMTEQERREYVAFMCNIENEYNCDKCPENKDADTDFCRQYPCGQQNCWVTCHCRQKGDRYGTITGTD